MISLLFLGSLLLLLAIRRWARLQRFSRLPPGPPGLPILGNILQLPKTFLHLHLDAWAKQYGPFYSFWIMGQPFVVIGNVEVASDVLDGMSLATSNRPPMIKIREFYSYDYLLTGQDNTPTWRAQRRAVHSSLNVRAASRLWPMQTHEASQLVLGLLQHPDLPFHKHAHRYSASVIMSCLYGTDEIPLLGPDPSKRIEELTNEWMKAAMPQNSVVDKFPILKPIIQRVKYFRREADKWFQDSYHEAKRLYEAASPTDRWGATTFAQDLRTNGDKYEVAPDQRYWLATTLFSAGQETTHTALRIFVLAMLHHPNVARTAQSQLDAICGSEPPTFALGDKLPYIHAVVKETLRWRPGVPMSVPHYASEDFEYRGHLVPKGTIILDNLWSETRDLSVYENPEAFDPTRFLDASGNVRHGNQDARLDQLGFGHGRRICPGRDFAYNSMFIAVAYLLWAFDFHWPRDENGREMVFGVDDFFDNGLAVAPNPFDVLFSSRKPGLEERLTVSKEG